MMISDDKLEHFTKKQIERIQKISLRDLVISKSTRAEIDRYIKSIEIEI